MNNEASAISQLYSSYLEEFHKQQDGSAHTFYAAPCLFVTEDAVYPLASDEDVQGFFSVMYQGLRASGYSHSETGDIDIKLLGSSLAQLSCSVTRYTNNSAQPETFHAVYTLKKCDGQWKFVSVTTYSPQA